LAPKGMPGSGAASETTPMVPWEELCAGATVEQMLSLLLSLHSVKACAELLPEQWHQ
jgi:hypothetical protein